MKNFFVYVTLLMIMAYSGCNKSDDELPEVFNETCNPISFEGLDFSIDGDISSVFDPLGDPYNNYLECVNDCAEVDPDNPDCMMDCLYSSGLMPLGGAYTLVIYITNISQIDITITIDPGTWFLPESGDYQPMLVVVTIPITVLVGETITVSIPVFCLASDKSAPDESSDYNICELVNLDCLTDIVNILRTKDFSLITTMEVMEIQANIWYCTEGQEVDFEFLNSLPDIQ
jgi:hypothetical protein